MTKAKISEKEYINSLIDIVKAQVEKLVFKDMVEEFDYIQMSYHANDVTRVIESLIIESTIKIQNNFKSFIKENGVPRKQRVKKEDKKEDKKEGEKYEKKEEKKEGKKEDKKEKYKKEKSI